MTRQDKTQAAPVPGTSALGRFQLQLESTARAPACLVVAAHKEAPCWCVGRCGGTMGGTAACLWLGDSFPLRCQVVWGLLPVLSSVCLRSLPCSESLVSPRNFCLGLPLGVSCLGSLLGAAGRASRGASNAPSQAPKDLRTHGMPFTKGTELLDGHNNKAPSPSSSGGFVICSRHPTTTSGVLGHARQASPLLVEKLVPLHELHGLFRLEVPALDCGG